MLSVGIAESERKKKTFYFPVCVQLCEKGRRKKNANTKDGMKKKIEKFMKEVQSLFPFHVTLPTYENTLSLFLCSKYMKKEITKQKRKLK